jgi:hypothetical protein
MSRAEGGSRSSRCASATALRSVPVRVAQIDGRAEELGELVLLALAESEPVDSDGPGEVWERAMLAAGVTERQIARRRAVSVDELSDASVRVEALRPVVGGGWEPAGDLGVLFLRDADPETLAHAVVVAAATWDPWSGARIQL